LITEEGELDRCIKRPVYENPEWFSEILTTYRAYQKGFLPNEGALNSQPKGFLQMVNIVDDALNSVHEIRRNQPPPGKQELPPPRKKDDRPNTHNHRNRPR
jgi:hypothetical protein